MKRETPSAKNGPRERARPNGDQDCSRGSIKGREIPYERRKGGEDAKSSADWRTKGGGLQQTRQRGGGGVENSGAIRLREKKKGQRQGCAVNVGGKRGSAIKHSEHSPPLRHKQANGKKNLKKQKKTTRMNKKM